MYDNKTQLVEKGGSSFFEKGSTITEGGGGGSTILFFLMGVTMWLNWWFPPRNFKILIANGAF